MVEDLERPKETSMSPEISEENSEAPDLQEFNPSEQSDPLEHSDPTDILELSESLESPEQPLKLSEIP